MPTQQGFKFVSSQEDSHDRTFLSPGLLAGLVLGLRRFPVPARRIRPKAVMQAAAALTMASRTETLPNWPAVYLKTGADSPSWTTMGLKVGSVG